MGIELAPYAAHPDRSRGRLHAEAEPALRTGFQRDRDRVIHSSAFRRLEYKTQVFVNHEGDMFRTRLTHSIEVAQIGRTLARALSLNEDLTEAICLAHDLGHTPFGHAGQDALDECMREHGGFEHNLQSLRIVDLLEEKYAGFPGLNLTFETREGILKHCSKEKAATLGELGRRFLDGLQPGLEAQVANISDEIAYNNHDVDDGLRAGLISMEQLVECRLFNTQLESVNRRWPGLAERRKVSELIRGMIDVVVNDLVRTTRERLAQGNYRDMDSVRTASAALVRMSEAVHEQHMELKRFLHKNLYRHYRVQRMSHKAQQVIRTLFDAFFRHPELLPPDVQARLVPSSGSAEPAPRARHIADYIAGMTDRYAIAEHARITDLRETS